MRHLLSENYVESELPVPQLLSFIGKAAFVMFEPPVLIGYGSFPKWKYPSTANIRFLIIEAPQKGIPNFGKPHVVLVALRKKRPPGAGVDYADLLVGVQACH